MSALKNSGLVSVEEKAQGAAADVTVDAEGGAGAMVLLGKIIFLKFLKFCMHFLKGVQAMQVPESVTFSTNTHPIVLNSRSKSDRMIRTDVHKYVLLHNTTFLWTGHNQFPFHFLHTLYLKCLHHRYIYISANAENCLENKLVAFLQINISVTFIFVQCPWILLMPFVNKCFS